MQNQAKKTGELEKQIGQIMEFMAQIQEQSELYNSTVENLKEDFEIHDAITLGSAMEVGGEPKTSKPSQNMDEQLMLEEEENNKATAREEPPLSQPHMPSMPSTTTKAPTLKFKPMPDHVKYHRPFKDQFHAMGLVQASIEVSSGWKTLKQALLGRQPMYSNKEDF
ncbi:hypothetical protein ACFXTN_003226 [Malus domestica]